MAGKFYLVGLIAGAILIAIGAVSIFTSEYEFAFIHSMTIIITGIIALALGIRFRALKH